MSVVSGKEPGWAMVQGSDLTVVLAHWPQNISLFKEIVV